MIVQVTILILSSLAAQTPRSLRGETRRALFSSNMLFSWNFFLVGLILFYASPVYSNLLPFLEQVSLFS